MQNYKIQKWNEAIICPFFHNRKKDEIKFWCEIAFLLLNRFATVIYYIFFRRPLRLPYNIVPHPANAS